MIQSKHEAAAHRGESTIPIVLALLVLLFAAILALTGGAGATGQSSKATPQAQNTPTQLAQAEVPVPDTRGELQQPR